MFGLIFTFQQDQHVINKAFQDHPIERASMKNKTGRVRIIINIYIYICMCVHSIDLFICRIRLFTEKIEMCIG